MKDAPQYFYIWSAYADEWQETPSKIVKLFGNRYVGAWVSIYNSPYRGHKALKISGVSRAKVLSLAKAIGEYTNIGSPKAKDILTRRQILGG